MTGSPSPRSCVVVVTDSQELVFFASDVITALPLSQLELDSSVEGSTGQVYLEEESVPVFAIDDEFSLYNKPAEADRIIVVLRSQQGQFSILAKNVLNTTWDCLKPAFAVPSVMKGDSTVVTHVSLSRPNGLLFVIDPNALRALIAKQQGMM